MTTIWIHQPSILIRTQSSDLPYRIRICVGQRDHGLCSISGSGAVEFGWDGEVAAPGRNECVSEGRKGKNEWKSWVVHFEDRVFK